MTASVLLEGNLKDGNLDALKKMAEEKYPITRSYDGCIGINLTINFEDSNNFVMTETWDSKEHYEKYLQFRIEDGTVAELTDLCVEAPSIRIFDITSI